jgi:hypothetical protein
MDPKDDFSSRTIYFIFFLCLVVFGFVYFEIFRGTAFEPEKPVETRAPAK